MVCLGGPIRSGGFVLFGLIAPFYALVFPSRRRAVWMFVAYWGHRDGRGAGRPRAVGPPLPPPSTSIFFAVVLATMSVFVFITLHFFVRERDRAFGLLREAQDKSPGCSGRRRALPDHAAVVSGRSRGDRRSLGADAIGIWEIVQEHLTALSAGPAGPPVDELRGRRQRPASTPPRPQAERSMPVCGMSGELCGALVIAGRTSSWGEIERRLVAGLAHQVGAALDVTRMRRQLAAAEERRAATRREMQERGIATLQICPACERCYDHTAVACTVDRARLESPRALPYRLLGRYRFLRVLGQGGMGTVLAAHDEQLDREVAVKLIRPEHFNDPERKQRFAREAQTVARIQHRGVVALYDSGEVRTAGPSW